MKQIRSFVKSYLEEVQLLKESLKQTESPPYSSKAELRNYGLI